MSPSLIAEIRAHLDRQEQIGWHLDWPEALDTIRAVMDEADRIEKDGEDGPLEFVARAIADQFRGVVAKALGITEDGAR